MNSDSENFEQLRKLLALKRHEQPPPGYFNNFSGKVIARIESASQAEDGLAWLRRLWALVESKPMLTGAFGAAVCALVISGLIFSDDVESASNGVRVAAGGANSPLGGNGQPLAMNPASDHSQFTSSTNPVSPELNSLLNNFQINAQPASAGFGFPVGN
jgi:hypothetical protein